MSNYQNMDNGADFCDGVDARLARPEMARDRSLNDVFTYLGDLFSKLTGNLGELLTLHKDLLKAEVQDATKRIARDGAMLAVGAVLGVFTLSVFTLALIAVISGVLPIDNLFYALAAGSAIVGVLYAAVAGILVMMGLKNLKKGSLTPDRTLYEVQRDKQAVKELA